MVIKTYRDEAAGHVKTNLWMWIAILGAATALAALMHWRVGGPSIWGDVMAFAGMITGILVIIRSQQGFHPHHATPEAGSFAEGRQA